LGPLGSLLLHDQKPPATVRLLPKEMQAVNVREHFIQHLEGLDGEVCFLAAAVVHSCTKNRSSLPPDFLESAKIVPKAPEVPQKTDRMDGLLKMFFNPFGACQARPFPAHEMSAIQQVETLLILLNSMEQHVVVDSKTLHGLCRILLDLLSEPAVLQNSICRSRTTHALQSAFQNAAHQLGYLVATTKAEDYLLDIFAEEWDLQKAANAGELCSGLHCILPRDCKNSLLDSAGFSEKDLRPTVCSFLAFRMLLSDLEERSSEHVEAGAAPQVSAAQHEMLRQKASEEISPLEVQAEVAAQFREEECIELGNMERIMCSMKMPDGKSMRYFLLDDFWLVLAQPDLAAPGCVVVKMRWPLWQVHSCIDCSNPSILQLATRSSCLGQDRGSLNPRRVARGSESVMVELEFDDMKRCEMVDSHCQSRRNEVRGEMREKTLDFILGCVGIQSQVVVPNSGMAMI